MIKSIGATVGSFIAFGVNFNSITAQGVSNGVFAAYVAIQACAVLIVFFFVSHTLYCIRLLLNGMTPGCGPQEYHS